MKSWFEVKVRAMLGPEDEDYELATAKNPIGNHKPSPHISRKATELSQWGSEACTGGCDIT